MESKTAKTAAGLGIVVALVFLFFLNQITSSTTPTSIYSPGARQPQSAPRSPSRRPHVTVSSALSHPPLAGGPTTSAPRVSQHATRHGTRAPLRHPAHRPVHHPAPPTHHPRPPVTSPPVTTKPTPPPNIVCGLLRKVGVHIC